jgi:acetate kinase
MPSMKVLVFNCGSSSLKFELLELDASGRNRNRPSARGIFQEIGPRSKAVMTDGEGKSVEASSPAPDHVSAALRALGWLNSTVGELALDATAHRIVHGGEHVIEPTLVNEAVIRKLEEASRFAPLHNPPALATIRAVSQKLVGLPTIVVADTAFHQTLPKYARAYAIPRELAMRHGIRRFGFHGLGHAWMMERYAEIRGLPAERLKLITLQLGAGCSATAISMGRSVDTSMGLTPLEGLMMATRSGDLDPAIFNYLAASEGLTSEQVEYILYHQSGFLGVSGLSSDMRELESAEHANENAALAIEMFCYRIRKYLGAYFAVLGGADAIIFGGGIGEHSANVRARVCSGLERLGMVLDPERNREANGREARISADGSPVEINVIPLDEELYMARAAALLLSNRKARNANRPD